jgi:NarL family two-component system sensor histidine kinase LiaS
MQVAAAQSLIDRDPAAAKDRLAQAERLVGQAQRELTALILELRPAALAGKGLGAALHDYCADWSRQTSIASDVRLLGDQPSPLATEQALFRVAQEALANVARHSGATAVDVHLAWSGKQLELTIQDNGHGFDAAAPPSSGVGFGSMRERVEALGGTLLLASAPTGTRVHACVPLAEFPGETVALSAGTHADETARAQIGEDV